MNPPLVTVITPFHNTVAYLAQCIESVLSQSYEHFDYVLSDNHSTDGSWDIAESYARRDPRIRLIRQPQFLSQVQHYNSALEELPNASQYCKLVQADDYLLPSCLEFMVRGFEQSESIGLVSSYWLKGDVLRGSGFPHEITVLRGKEMGQLYLRKDVFVFGSPTAVCYRSSLVRQCKPFYDEGLPHEDTEKCLQILEHWDFGFIHQVLSFSRADNESVSSLSRTFQPFDLDRYILVRRYAASFLEAAEAANLRRASKSRYYRILAKEAVKVREPAFWRHHRDGLKTLGESIERPYLALLVCRELLWLVANPGQMVLRLWRWWVSRTMGSKAKAIVLRQEGHSLPPGSSAGSSC